jgi:hypothetical protein
MYDSSAFFFSLSQKFVFRVPQSRDWGPLKSIGAARGLILNFGRSDFQSLVCALAGQEAIAPFSVVVSA